MLLETDSPYMKNRVNTINTQAFIGDVASIVASQFPSNCAVPVKGNHEDLPLVICLVNVCSEFPAEFWPNI